MTISPRAGPMSTIRSSWTGKFVAFLRTLLARPNVLRSKAGARLTAALYESPPNMEKRR
jgi:hypothetical protein